MVRIYADFNDKTPDGGYWILQHEGVDLSLRVQSLGLSGGDHVLLYQDDGDFEVSAALAFTFVDAVGREAWVAYPDWATLKRDRVVPGPTVRKVV
jgi:hypothetical protein